MKIEIELTEEEKREVDEIWNFTKHRLPERTRKTLGWENYGRFPRRRTSS